MLKSWAILAKRVVQSNIDRLDLPYKLFFVVTKECHSRCQNCKIWTVQPKNELSFDEINKFAQNSPFLQWINLSGGETTDRKDLVEIVAAFQKHCPNLLLINFATNGLRPDHIEKVSKQIASLNIPRFVITVSIDGPPKVNDALRGLKGDFAAAVETYKRLSQIENLDTYVGLTMYSQNIHLIDETVSEIRKTIPTFSHKKLHINMPHISGHYFENIKTNAPTKSDMIHAIENYAKKRGNPHTIFEWLEKIYQIQAKKFLETQKTPLVCSALMSQIFLSEHGDVFPCTIWDKKLGNIRESNYSLVPILRNHNTLDVRSQIKAGNCPNCWTPCEAYPTIAANFLKIRG